ncbi:MAG: hypothetical protein NTZ87_04075 [Candidatus Nomurabacteria bacterium]|nr:hypothetical protein [Candidatus Nomurabacteria bacterium]
MQKIKLMEICNHCGDSVTFGSGKFVNRVPDFNDKETKFLIKGLNPLVILFVMNVITILLPSLLVLNLI